MGGPTPSGVLDATAPSVLVIAGSHVVGEAVAEALRRRTRLDHVQTVVGAASASALAEWCDLVLVDMSFERADEILISLRSIDPGSRVIAFAVPDSERAIIACAEMGVVGLLPASGDLEALARIVEATSRGQASTTGEAAGALLRRIAELSAAGIDAREDPTEHLTPREREVLDLIERGWTNKQIARALSIEVRTVKNHVHNLLEKLRVSRRGEAAARLRSARVPSLGVLRAAGARTGPSAPEC